MNKVLILLAIVGMVFLAPPGGRCELEVREGLSRFDHLKERLVADGFDEKWIEELYRHPEARFIPQKVEKYLTYKEKELNYEQFLKERFVVMGRQYLEQYQNTLHKASEQYNISPQVIVALLTIETQLGNYTGKYSVFNILSSLAVARSADLNLDSHSEPSEDLVKKLERRAKWAYSELKAFLIYSIKQNIDPFSIKGSFAGAFGIAQFVPSSLLNYGCDGDGDGIVDLYNHHDAIMSVARYLNAHGWNEDGSREHKEKVLRRYNWSIYYVKAVLDLSEKLGTV